MAYALFHFETQISRAHPHVETAWVEAFERKLMWSGRIGPRGEYATCLASGFSLREITEPNESQGHD